MGHMESSLKLYLHIYTYYVQKNESEDHCILLLLVKLREIT